MVFTESNAGLFYCNPARYQYICGNDKRYAIYSDERKGHVVAWLTSEGNIIGMVGNHGNDRYKALADYERNDIESLLNKMIKEDKK